jgi:hypothetical protein
MEWNVVEWNAHCLVLIGSIDPAIGVQRPLSTFLYEEWNVTNKKRVINKK